MKPLKLLLLALPLILITDVEAQNLDDPSIIGNPSSSTFGTKNKSSQKRKIQEERQMEMQREESNQKDSFGESKFNENTDPNDYRVDDQMLKQKGL